jgi:predicted RNA binding protein YcfA (HicA-like mRNA interferase family)
MMNATDREVRRVLGRLRKEGWRERSGKGSHKVFEKEGKRLTVPVSKDPIPIGTYRQIARTAEWL